MREKLLRLKDMMREYRRVAVAFSGGVDSTFLLKVAVEELGDNAVAITSESILSATGEISNAKALAASIGAKHIIINQSPLSNKRFAANPPNRCYFCKLEIFGRMIEEAGKLNIRHVLEGTNKDDEDDFRPGSIAVAELGVLCPLREAGLRKHEIRMLSAEYGLSTWDKPSLACLASRIPYGSEITPDKLEMVDKAEDYLRRCGFSRSQIRVRHHDDVARIELDADGFRRLFESDINEVIYDEFRRIGFKYVSVDLRGYRTGSLNE
ncbi:MAG: ATP-dependent sacrificial sulfur transferase LarE [Oscillospiraceae bacterium]|nr:ATP-dependent sacrificial sulfur transferase LarE [Oscillospiraceae bacterium]